MKFNRKKLLSELLSSKLKNGVLEHLTSNNAPVSERQMAKILRVSHTAVNKVMKELLDYNLVKATSVGSSLVWKINKKSISYRLLQQYLALQTKSLNYLFINSLKHRIRILELESKLAAKRKAPAKTDKGAIEAHVIGSVAQETAESDSDIDILLITNSEVKKFLLTNNPKLLTELIVDFGGEIGNNLSIQIFTNNEIEKKPKLHWVKDSIKKGIKVYPLSNKKQSRIVCVWISRNAG